MVGRDETSNERGFDDQGTGTAKHPKAQEPVPRKQIDQKRGDEKKAETKGDPNGGKKKSLLGVITQEAIDDRSIVCVG